MPWGAAAFAILFEEDLFGEVPDVFRVPEIAEQFAERDRRDQFVELLRGARIRVLVVRFFFSSCKEFKGQGTRVLDTPVAHRPASGELLGIEKSLNQDSAVFGECFSFGGSIVGSSSS